MSSKFFKILGPGVLFASCAIGVSHLVQSTRAGAEYGFALIGFVIAANIFKFPFFEFGSRYATATGTSLIDGYKRLHTAVLWMYAAITLFSMFFVIAAVAFVTAGFMENLFGVRLPVNLSFLSSLILLSVCCVILIAGKYKVLDNLIKVVAVVLLISTVAAFILALVKGPKVPTTNFFNLSLINENSFPFIIALMGWMPTAVDLSTWNSLWTLEKIKTSGYKPTVKETVLEFNVGYWISAGLSICFVTLGAFMVFGTSTAMPDNKAQFASMVVSLYAQTFGNWSYFIIAAAAFSIMFSTSISILDGYARAASKTVQLILNKPNNESSRNDYIIWLLITAFGGFIIISIFSNQLRTLVDLATTISFLVAPIVAFFNYKLVFGHHLKEEDKPSSFMKILSILGIVFLSGFTIFYIYKILVPKLFVGI